MAKFYVVLVFGLLLLAHASYARNIPTKNALAPNEYTKNVVTATKANAPVGNGVDDEKNFITYGGVGGWAGIGGYAGVGGGLGGAGGLGGVGGAGGGLGGLGGGVGVGGGIGGAGGIGGIIP